MSETVLKTFDLGKIVGPAGANGTNGANGEKGDKGETGKSAYLSAVQGGYTGTEAQFYADLASVSGKVSTSRRVNGKALSSDIALSASDVGAIPVDAKGQPSGVATLDATGKIPSSQLPSPAIFPKIMITAVAGLTVTLTDGTTAMTVTSNGTAEFTVPHFGLWTASAYFPAIGETVTKRIAVESVSVIRATLTTSFSELDWEEIVRLSGNTALQNLWSVNDTHELTIGKDSYTVSIIGKHHDTLASGGTAPLTLMLNECYGFDPHGMGIININHRWKDSGMRTEQLPPIFDKLPTVLKNGIREVIKKNDDNVSTTDKLFLLSETEVYTADLSANDGATRYAAFDLFGNGPRIRRNLSGNRISYLLRSRWKTDLSYSRWVIVKEDGSVDKGTTGHIVFAFCL